MVPLRPGRGWATGSGSVVGRGFVPGLRVANMAVGAGGDLYVVRMNGDLILYRHTGFATNGPVTWTPRRTLGTGWNFIDLASAGAGVLYATDGDTRGVYKLTLRVDAYGTTIDPTSCSSVS